MCRHHRLSSVDHSEIRLQWRKPASNLCHRPRLDIFLVGQPRGRKVKYSPTELEGPFLRGSLDIHRVGSLAKVRASLPRKRKSMRKSKEVLRLHFERGFGQRVIAREANVSQSITTTANSSTRTTRKGRSRSVLPMGIKTKFLLSVFAAFHRAAQTTGPNLINEETAYSIGGGRVVARDLRSGRVAWRAELAAEYTALCPSGDCDISWMSDEGASAFVAKSLRSNEIGVFELNGKLRWSQMIRFQPLSRASLSRSRNIVAFIGRVDGESHLWYATPNGLTKGQSVSEGFVNSRMTIAWLARDEGVIVAVDKMLYRCAQKLDIPCRQLVAGDLPAVSPDGRFLAYFEVDRSLAIRTVSSLETVQKIKSEDGRIQFGDDLPRWTSRSSHVVVNAFKSGKSRLIAVDLNTNRLTGLMYTYGKTSSGLGIGQ